SLNDRRREERTHFELRRDTQSLRLQLGREVDEVGFGHALPIEWRRLSGERLSCRSSLAGDIRLRYRALDDRPDWFARHSIEDVGETLFSYLRHSFHSLAIDGHIQQHRSRCGVPIPDVVMDQ